MKIELRKLQILISEAENLAQEILEERQYIFEEEKDGEFQLSPEGEIFEDETLIVNDVFDDIQNIWSDLEELLETREEN